MHYEFPRDRERALVGQKVDSMPAAIVSVTSNAQAAIAFGALVVFDESDAFLCKVPTSTDDINKPVGITLRQLHLKDYQAKSSIAAMRKGRIWVQAEKVEAPGDAVFVKFSDDGLIFTGVKTDNTQLKGAIFLEKSEGGKVPIEVDFFGGAL